MGIFIFWVVFSIVVAAIGQSRRIGAAGAFFLSLLLSPLIGLIVTLISPSKESIEQNARLISEQKRTNELLEKSTSNSFSQELNNLQQMRMNGTLTEEEYEKLRSRIIEGNA